MIGGRWGAAALVLATAAGPAAAQPGDLDEAWAVDGCIAYVGDYYAQQRDGYARVETILSVEPTRKGWRVRGRLREENARGGVRFPKFRCSINRKGTSRSLTVG